LLGAMRSSASSRGHQQNCRGAGHSVLVSPPCLLEGRAIVTEVGAPPMLAGDGAHAFDFFAGIWKARIASA
jgi:hypothetical protein